MQRGRTESVAHLLQRKRSLQAKLDRGYEDYLEARISAGFWMRKSEEWKAHLTAIESELTRPGAAVPEYAATGERILELAKTAHILYESQDAAEQRRLLETVLSNYTFDRGSLCPTCPKPFDLPVQGQKTGNWRGGRDSCPLAFAEKQ